MHTTEIIALLNSANGDPWRELIPEHRLQGAESEDVTPARVAAQEDAGEYDAESFLASTGHKLYRLPGGEWQDGGAFDFAATAIGWSKEADRLRQWAADTDIRAARLEDLSESSESPDDDLFEAAGEDARILAEQRRARAAEAADKAAFFGDWTRELRA